VIDPYDCIDCGACIPECPVGAIYTEEDVPSEEQEWIEINEIESETLPHAEGDSPVLASE